MSDQSVTLPSTTGNEPRGTIELTLKHQGIESKIIGTPDGVIRELLAYFSKIYPALDLASKIVLTIDSSEFLQACSGILAATQEGLAVLKDVTSLRDKELVMLYLAGSRLMNLIGRKDSDTSSLEELTKWTDKATGTVAGRLSELCNEQLAERVGKGSYRLTTMGTRTVVMTLLPKTAVLQAR